MSTLEKLALFFGAAGALAVVLVACTSFSAGDAAPATADEAGDARLAAEASADGLLPDGAPVPFDCNAHRVKPGFLYCNDFEQPTDSIDPFGFTSSTMPDSAARIAVVRDGERLHVLEVTTTAPDAASGDANLVQKLGVMSPTPSLQLDFDVKIVTDDLSGVTLTDLHISGNPCEASFGLGAFGGMNVGTTRSAVTQIPYANDWRHVTIALVADATSSTKYREVSSYGGAPFVDREAQISAGGPLTAACNFDTLRVGLLERGGGGAQATVHYDNILVRKLP